MVAMGVTTRKFCFGIAPEVMRNTPSTKWTRRFPSAAGRVVNHLVQCHPRFLAKLENAAVDKLDVERASGEGFHHFV